LRLEKVCSEGVESRIEVGFHSGYIEIVVFNSRVITHYGKGEDRKRQNQSDIALRKYLHRVQFLHSKLTLALCRNVFPTLAKAVKDERSKQLRDSEAMGRIRRRVLSGTLPSSREAELENGNL
jgi:hypothetical protein